MIPKIRERRDKGLKIVRKMINRIAFLLAGIVVVNLISNIGRTSGEDVAQAAKDVTSYVSTAVNTTTDIAGLKYTEDTAVQLKFSGDYVTKQNDNVPSFTKEDLNKSEGYMYLTELDSLGRSGMAMMVVSPNTITYEERESISDIRPVGFVQAKYACISDDGNTPGYVYNRMHLLMYHAGGPLRDVRNITTGTRFCNATLMLTYEDAVVDYVKETGNNVLYRVTALYNEGELVPRAIQMEAYSMQDEGEGVCFNILAWNVQPGITINYETGETTADNGEVSSYMGNQ